MKKEYKDGAFVVPSGSLGFSVTIFTICALICIGTLLIRRRVFGCELGGPATGANLSAASFVLLWFIYVLMSGLEIYDIIVPFDLPGTR